MEQLSPFSYDIELDNLFYNYEQARVNGEVDPQELTSSYKEYTNEVTPARLTPVPRGFFFPYQEQQCRYILQEGKDALLGILDPGTGKTFIGVMISEMFRGNYNPSLPRDPRIEALPPAVRQYLTPTRENIKRCIYLTANQVLDREVMNTIPIVKNTTAVSIEDNKWYTSRTFGVFLTKYSKLYHSKKVEFKKQLQDLSPEEAEEEAERRALSMLAGLFETDLSDSFIVIDEAHRLGGENLDNIARGENINYKLIHLLVHSIKRSKLIVFTATPMNNSTNEIIPILNLILPLELNLPLKTTNFDAMTDSHINDLLTELVGDRVFYVTANPTGMEPFYLGQKLEGTPFSYDRLEMEGKQLERYLDVVRGDLSNLKLAAGEEKVDEESTIVGQTRDTSYLIEAATQLCWLPIDEAYTRKGGKNIVSSAKLQPIIHGPNSEVVRAIAREQEERVREAMRERARRSGQSGEATRRDREQYENTVRNFVDVIPYIFDRERMAKYGEYPENWRIDGPPGNNLRQRSVKYYQILSEALGPQGDRVHLVYFRYLVNGGLETFAAIALLNGYERYENTMADVSGGDRIVGLEKKKRFIILTPGMKSATVSMWLRIVMHPDNVNGEYINLVLISPGMKIGISVFSVRRIYHTGPEWSPWGELQSIYRGLREGGSTAYLKSIGQWPDGKMRVDISLQCAVVPPNLPRSELKYPRPFTHGLTGIDREHLTTLDMDMYVMLSKKYKNHLRVLGPLRDMSVGCRLNKTRNREATKCSPLTTIGPQVVEPFNILYSRKYRWALKHYIRQVMRTSREPVHIADLFERTRNYNIPIILYYQAIHELVQEAQPIMSELGLPLYIAYDRDRIFLQQDYTIGEGPAPEQDFLLSYYSNYSAITHTTPVVEVKRSLTNEEIAAIQKVKKVGELRQYIRTHYPTVEEQILLLETALLQSYGTDWRKGGWSTLLQVYYTYWGYFTDFKSAVIAHSFVSFLHEAGYPIVARLQRPSRYRYMVSAPGEWTTTYERSALVDSFYHVYSRRKVEELFQDHEDFPIAIGTICDGEFRVVTKRGDSRTGMRGRMIRSYDYLELVYIGILIGWIPTLTGTSMEAYSREDIEQELRDEIQSLFGDNSVEIEDLLIDTVNAIETTYTRERVVQELMGRFIELDRVIYA
jgi:hypothetical protein